MTEGGRIPAVAELPELCTVEEYGKIVRRRLTACYEDVRKGRIRSVRLGGSIRIPRAAIEELLGIEAPTSKLRAVK